MITWEAAHYFSLFLQEAGCSNILFEELKLSSDKYVFGFDCDSEDLIYALLTQLKLTGHLYKNKKHCLLTLTSAQLQQLVQTHFEKVLNEWRTTYADYAGTYEQLRFIFYSNLDYEDLKASSKKLQKLRDIGLDYGEVKQLQLPEYIFNPFFSGFPQGLSFFPYESPYSQIREVWEGYLVITDMQKLFQAYGKEIVGNVFSQITQTTFLMGLHPVYGAHSTLKNLRENPLFESKLLPLIFSFAESTPAKSSLLLETKKSEGISEIQAAITILDQEIKHPFYLFNLDRKRQKIEFLKLILQFKNANPALSTKSCIEFATKENRGLSQEAMKGCFSSRTSALMERLKAQDEEVAIEGRSPRLPMA